MRAAEVMPDEVSFEADGMHLHWRRRCAAARYAGDVLAWPDVRDADPAASPPEVRLTDGRTVFLPAQLGDRLIEALARANVPVVQRPPVWAHLLEPCLNTDYAAVRERIEAELRQWGFTDRELRRIRQRIGMRMAVVTFVTRERSKYGQMDVLLARFALPPQHTSWRRYRRFREWTDAIADRGEIREIPPDAGRA